MKAPKRIRSTTAPEISATVMMQKVAWNAKNTRWGIVVPSRGSKVTSCSADVAEASDRSPVPSKASE